MTESGGGAVELIPCAAGMKKQFTATGYVVNPSRTRLLMIFHRGLGRWLPPEGLVDVTVKERKPAPVCVSSMC